MPVLEGVAAEGGGVMSHVRKPHLPWRTTYMPTDPNPFIRLAKFDRAMQAADRIAEEQEA